MEESSSTTDDDLPVAVAPPLPFDEEPWQNQVAPVQAAFARLLLPDPEEIPAGSLVVLVGPPDEDYWVNQVTPIQAVIYQRLPLGDPKSFLPVLCMVYLTKIFGQRHNCSRQPYRGRHSVLMTISRLSLDRSRKISTSQHVRFRRSFTGNYLLEIQKNFPAF